ncbi:MAG: S8 family serine peptidase [Gammaproteobacteria bacterium]|nr:S8 family serine peptidase [Gammaproteobacteria bacterium]
MSRAAKPASSISGKNLFPTALLVSALALSASTHGAGDAEATLRQALKAVCEDSSASLERMAARIPGGTGVAEEPLSVRSVDVGWKRRFALPGGVGVRIEHFAPGGRLRRLVAEYWNADSNEGGQPLVAAITDADCTIRFGRRLVYEPESPAPFAVEHLDANLAPTGRTEPLNPPVPEGGDPGGVPVAIVDAGVNYLLPGISQRLARNEQGRILGHDYWDLDRRPFDANPAGSPFFPQRHGTRTASLLLREAPGARLLPYRYPRPDMSRMTRLVADAAGKDVVVVNMSLGSNNPEEWEAFAAAAGAHPDMLFVLSAGNNGRDIDARPVYPAALELPNTITVTSAENNGDLAPGSNRGRRSVDLTVPAEGLVVTDFDGSEVSASGSSYAAVRISALAARLMSRHPGWTAAELKDAIVARALPLSITGNGEVARGFIPRPDRAEHLPPMSDEGEPAETARHILTAADLYAADTPVSLKAYALVPTFALFEDTGWELAELRRHARRAADILSQCGIHIPQIDIRVLDGPDMYRYFHDAISKDLVRRLPLPTPAVYFVRDTLQVNAFDAEAIGRSNSAQRPALRDTVWVAEGARDPGIALAHELVHVLMDSGRHVDTPDNLMRADTAPSNTKLSSIQCKAIARDGMENGLLTTRRRRPEGGQPPGR